MPHRKIGGVPICWLPYFVRMLVATGRPWCSWCSWFVCLFARSYIPEQLWPKQSTLSSKWNQEGEAVLKTLGWKHKEKRLEARTNFNTADTCDRHLKWTKKRLLGALYEAICTWGKLWHNGHSNKNCRRLSMAPHWHLGSFLRPERWRLWFNWQCPVRMWVKTDDNGFLNLLCLCGFCNFGLNFFQWPSCRWCSPVSVPLYGDQLT